MMQQSWFEMTDLGKRRFDTAAWIPLRAIHTKTSGRFGHPDYREEFFGVASLAVPVAKRSLAEELRWNELGISHSHSPYVDHGRYTPVDVSRHNNKLVGLRLVLEQRGNCNESRQWYIHPDLVIALRLKREEDAWLSIDEGYEQVIRLQRDAQSIPILFEIRAEHLKDYLCARRMGLYVNSFWSRVEVVERDDHISWPSHVSIRDVELDHWEGRVREIYEGGRSFGSKTHVFHMSRTDVDANEDVPQMGPPNDSNVGSANWELTYEGQKLFEIRGELWRSEWIKAGNKSYRVRGDRKESTVEFTKDAAGNRESGDALTVGGQWLWFKPQVMLTLTNYRGGSLEWYTREAGRVCCSPEWSVHFGINKKGFITVYMKDIGELPEWQQRIWAGFNITPDGGVSAELLASQAEATPAQTQAPEAHLSNALEGIDFVARQKCGDSIVRASEQFRNILRTVNRFQGLDDPGLFSLAKELIRLTADSIDVSVLQRLASPPKGEKWGSLKSFQHVAALAIGEEDARSLLSPLFAIYELRLADAHPARHEIDAAFIRLDIDRTLPHVFQSLQMLVACVSSLFGIADVLKMLPNYNGDKRASTSPT